MNELSEMIFAEITNQTLTDHTAMVTDSDLAGMFGVTIEEVKSVIESLIEDNHMIRLNKNRYSIKF